MTIPEYIGHYRILQKIGEGGMGVVYKAQAPDGHIVALKQILADRAHDQDTLHRFDREARILKQLHHKHIVQLIDYINTSGQLPYFVMDYIDGLSISEVLAYNKQPLTIANALWVIGPVAGALDYAHRRRILHRDISTSNILISRVNNQVYLTDFGIATDPDPNPEVKTSLTQLQRGFGKVGYIAPEIYEGQPATERSEVYALGITLYRMLTGKYYDKVGMDWRDFLPRPELAPVFERALSSRPERRYPDIRSLYADFEQEASRLISRVEPVDTTTQGKGWEPVDTVHSRPMSVTGTEPKSRVTSPPQKLLRRLSIIAAAIVGLLVLLVVATLLSSSGDNGADPNQALNTSPTVITSTPNTVAVGPTATRQPVHNPGDAMFVLNDQPVREEPDQEPDEDAQEVFAGTRVIITEQTTNARDHYQDGFYYVNFTGGTGWISENELVDEMPTPTPPEPTATLRPTRLVPPTSPPIVRPTVVAPTSPADPTSTPVIRRSS